MTDTLPSLYFSIRARITDAALPLDAGQLDRVVPACPDWTVHQLLTHVVAMPMAILSGEAPDGADPNPWLRRLVDDNSHRSVDELVAWWASDDDALGELLAKAGLLVADLFVHESDLHGAIGSIGHRHAPELRSQLAATLAGLQHQLVVTELAPIAVDTAQGRLATADGAPGWTLRGDPWEAHRALNSRRTASEVLALEADGDAGPYLQVLDEHLPLPATSLGEHQIGS